MLFNPRIRPGLVVFALICVFIDFVFNFNLSSLSQRSPPSLFYATQGFSTLRCLLSLKHPSVIHRGSANTSQSLPLILSLCSHQSFLGRSILLFPYISRCLCSQSPYMSNSDPIRHWASRGKETHIEEKESVCSLSSPMIDSDPV